MSKHAQRASPRILTRPSSPAKPYKAPRKPAQKPTWCRRTVKRALGTAVWAAWTLAQRCRVARLALIITLAVAAALKALWDHAWAVAGAAAKRLQGLHGVATLLVSPVAPRPAAATIRMGSPAKSARQRRGRPRTLSVESAGTFQSLTSFYSASGNPVAVAPVQPFSILRRPLDEQLPALPELGFPFPHAFMQLPNGVRLAFTDAVPAPAATPTAPAAAIRHTVVLFHGLSTWSFLWRRLVASLVEPPYRYRVVAVDWPGFGRSDRITQLGELSWDLYVTTAKYVLQELAMALRATDPAWYDASQSSSALSRSVTVVAHGAMGAVVAAALAQLGDAFVAQAVPNGGLWRLVLVDPAFPGVSRASFACDCRSNELLLAAQLAAFVVRPRPLASLWLPLAAAVAESTSPLAKDPTAVAQGYMAPFLANAGDGPFDASLAATAAALSGLLLPWPLPAVLSGIAASASRAGAVHAHVLEQQRAFSRLADDAVAYLRNFGSRAIGTTSFFNAHALRSGARRRLLLLTGRDAARGKRRPSPISPASVRGASGDSFAAWLCDWAAAEWVQLPGPGGWLPETQPDALLQVLTRHVESV